jgi:UDP-GlcNAc:undecaprenyl-phosphate GlcNAc-1-phosphate transferase
MLGDGGANALGAMLGTAAAVSLPRPARVAALAVVIGLTAASEVVSFTQVIARTPPLNWVDMLGRRPAPAAGSAPAAPDPAVSDPAVSGPAVSDPAVSDPAAPPAAAPR